jgi:hypothetical protein
MLNVDISVLSYMYVLMYQVSYMLMSYVSYRHALTTFKVELSKWDMEMALMHIETFHTIVV